MGHTSRVRSIGVEEELLLVDETSGRAVAVAAAALQYADGYLIGDASDADAPEGTLEPELQQQQLEINTRPCADITELVGEVRRFRELADLAARDAGARVAALATSPVPVAPRLTLKTRYQRLADRFGLTTSEQLTGGCHVHVEVASEDEAVGVLDRIRVWLPVLLACSANSPYWQGTDTGYDSFRSQAWSRWPTAGPTDVFGSAAGYREQVEGVLATDPALDTGMLYFDARIAQNYPTVEVRIADVCLEAVDTALLAALARALVETAAEEWTSGEPAPSVPTIVLRMASWRAGRSGLREELLDPRSGKPRPAAEVVAALLAHAGPALAQAGDEARAEHGLERLLRDGTGASRQRAVLRRTGDLAAVVRDAVERTQAAGPET